jgi:peptide/nickel transport system substrate-binding protein
MIRWMGLAGAVGLLAACQSKDSTGSGSTSSTTTSSTTTTSSGAATTTTSGGSAAATTAPSTSQASPAAAAATQAPAANKKKGGTLIVGFDSEPPTMDPHASPSAITFFITTTTSESLLYLTDKRELKPWLAASYEGSPDGKSFTFRLNKDVKFQDGTPFNAAAVKWNFDRIVDPNFKAGGALSALTGYTGTDTPDDLTAKVNFKDPFAPFLTYAAGGTLAMLSPDGTKKQGDAVNQTPITSGPYKITEWVAKSQATIQRWDDYNRRLPWADHDGPGYLDKVQFKFIPEAGTRVTTVESGETQMASVIPAQDLPRLESSSNLKIVKVPWVGAPRIWLFNVTKAPTDDVKVRQAINYAINKDAIVNTVYKGIGTKAIAPMTRIMLDDPSLAAYYPFDQNKAKQLLEEAGWTGSGTRQKNGQPLRIVLNAIDTGAGPEQAVVLIQGQLRDVGIDVQLKVQARAPWYEDNYNGATNGAVLFLRSGDLDGLYSLFHSSLVGSNFNFSMLKDPDIDKMLVQGRQESDPAKRKQIYLDLEKKLLDMAVSVPLVDELSVWAVRNSHTGLVFNGYTYPLWSEAAAV